MTIDPHDFARWARREAFLRPAGAKYAYANPTGCPLFFYLLDQGVPVESVGGFGYHDRDGRWCSIPDAIAYALSVRPHTWTGLADRLDGTPWWQRLLWRRMIA